MVLGDRILNILFQIGVHGGADNAAGASTSGARRVTLQERERQDADAEKRFDYKSMSNIYMYMILTKPVNIRTPYTS